MFPVPVKSGDKYCPSVWNPVSLSRINCGTLQVVEQTHFWECYDRKLSSHQTLWCKGSVVISYYRRAQWIQAVTSSRRATSDHALIQELIIWNLDLFTSTWPIQHSMQALQYLRKYTNPGLCHFIGWQVSNCVPNVTIFAPFIRHLHLSRKQ